MAENVIVVRVSGSDLFAFPWEHILGGIGKTSTYRITRRPERERESERARTGGQPERSGKERKEHERAGTLGTEFDEKRTRMYVRHEWGLCFFRSCG
jgi:hypothetical protein